LQRRQSKRRKAGCELSSSPTLCKWKFLKLPNGLNVNKSPCAGIPADELEAFVNILDYVLDSYVRGVLSAVSSQKACGFLFVSFLLSTDYA
jgi:hypothetical protein